MGCEHPPTNSIASVGEGVCPRCRERLNVEDGAGICPCCDMGWSATDDAVTMHIRVQGFTLNTDAGTFTSGPTRVRFSPTGG